MSTTLRIAAIGAFALAALSACGETTHSRFAVVAIESTPSAPKWLRLDTVTGDMVVCSQVDGFADAKPVPPPPPGFIMDPVYLCNPAKAGSNSDPLGIR